MTNLVISLMLVTNWTGFQKDGLELGYVTTNHLALISYQERTNSLVLKTEFSNKAVWRIAVPLPVLNETQVTNNIRFYPGYVLSNVNVEVKQ